MEILWIIKLITDLIFCIFQDAWSFVLLYKMDGNVWSLNMLEVRSTLFVFTWPIQRQVLEDDIMSPISKFRFVFNNNALTFYVTYVEFYIFYAFRLQLPQNFTKNVVISRCVSQLTDLEKAEIGIIGTV